MERAVIHCISFSKGSDHLACSSDKGTDQLWGRKLNSKLLLPLRRLD
jgi:hypothetical protein